MGPEGWNNLRFWTSNSWLFFGSSFLSYGFAERGFHLYFCCRTGLLWICIWLTQVTLCPNGTQGNPKVPGTSQGQYFMLYFLIYLIWEARMFASFPRISACFIQWEILNCASFSAMTLKVLILWYPESGLENVAGLFVIKMCSTVPQCLIAGEFLT